MILKLSGALRSCLQVISASAFLLKVHQNRCAFNKKSDNTKSALKDLKRTPLYLQEKFRAWLVAVNKQA